MKNIIYKYNGGIKSREKTGDPTYTRLFLEGDYGT